MGEKDAYRRLPRSQRWHHEGTHTVLKDRTTGGALSFFRDMKIGRKLAAAVGAAILALGGLSVIGVSALQAAGKDNDSLVKVDKAGRATMQADMMHDAVRGDVLRLLLFGDADRETTLKALADHSTLLKEQLALVTQADIATKVDAAVTAVKPIVDDYLLAAQQISKQTGENPKAARAAYPTFQAAFSKVEVQLPSVGDALSEQAATVATGTAHRRDAATRLLAVTGLSAALLLALFGWLVTRSVTGPLQRTVKVLEGLAEGRLDLTLEVDSKDEVGQMAVALNSAMAQLRETMSAMGNNAQGLASSSEELSSVSAQMTGSAEESASQANLVSAAAEQVSRRRWRPAPRRCRPRSARSPRTHTTPRGLRRRPCMSRGPRARRWPSWVSPPRRSGTSSR